eukprot:scaffold62365_cov44-Cyclotella_meneghiniana.AAC.10
MIPGSRSITGLTVVKFSFRIQNRIEYRSIVEPIANYIQLSLSGQDNTVRTESEGDLRWNVMSIGGGRMERPYLGR